MIEQIKTLIKPYLEVNKLSLVSCRIKTDYGINNIIEIILKGDYYTNNPEHVHYAILDLINDLMPEGYYLELSGVGAEYPLTEDDLINHLNYYIYLNSPQYNGYGYLLEYDETTKNLKIETMEKTRKKVLQITFNANVKIRTAVKV